MKVFLFMACLVCASLSWANKKDWQEQLNRYKSWYKPKKELKIKEYGIERKVANTKMDSPIPASLVVEFSSATIHKGQQAQTEIKIYGLNKYEINSIELAYKCGEQNDLGKYLAEVDHTKQQAERNYARHVKEGGAYMSFKREAGGEAASDGTFVTINYDTNQKLDLKDSCQFMPNGLIKGSSVMINGQLLSSRQIRYGTLTITE